MLLHYLLTVVLYDLVSGSVVEITTGVSPPAPSQELVPCSSNASLLCHELQVGQYYCDDPVIDPSTQSVLGCTEALRYVTGLYINPLLPSGMKIPNTLNEFFVNCYPAPGVCCNGFRHTGSSAGFKRNVPCRWTNGKSLSTALVLSIFLGWLGVDRFYLGYPALGLLKLCTSGFMLIWALIDILLIALQVVKPVDQSEYIVDYYGPMFKRILADNMTFMIPPQT